jgi:hypothetical protein
MLVKVQLLAKQEQKSEAVDANPGGKKELVVPVRVLFVLLCGEAAVSSLGLNPETTA